MKHKLNTI